MAETQIGAETQVYRCRALGVTPLTGEAARLINNCPSFSTDDGVSDFCRSMAAHHGSNTSRCSSTLRSEKITLLDPPPVVHEGGLNVLTDRIEDAARSFCGLGRSHR